MHSGNRFEAFSRGHRYGKVYNRNLPKWYKREPDSRIPNVPSPANIGDTRQLQMERKQTSAWRSGGSWPHGHLAEIHYYVKHSFSKDAAPELIERIAGENDIVHTAIGDCGSWCSCCIRDPIDLDRLGVPSAAVITTKFVRETELTRTALGKRGLTNTDRDRSPGELNYPGGNRMPCCTNRNASTGGVA